MNAISDRNTLHRLIYASRLRIAPEDLDHEVGLIIQAAIRNNRAVNITGLFLVHDGWFVQALEGSRDAVMTTYGKILGDHRHDSVKIVCVGPASQREFGDWNMCARGMNAADDAIVRTLSQRATFDPWQLTGPAVLKLLKAVRGIQHRTEGLAMV